MNYYSWCNTYFSACLFSRLCICLIGMSVYLYVLIIDDILDLNESVKFYTEIINSHL